MGDHTKGKTRIGVLIEILLTATKLGLTSFGGPVAHLAYFKDEYIDRKKWLTDKMYADLIALCQFYLGLRVAKSVFQLVFYVVAY